MTEQDKKKFKTVPAMDMDEYKQKIIRIFICLSEIYDLFSP